MAQQFVYTDEASHILKTKLFMFVYNETSLCFLENNYEQLHFYVYNNFEDMKLSSE